MKTAVKPPIPAKSRRLKAWRQTLCPLFLIAAFSTTLASEHAEKPNVVLVLADDLGIEALSLFGGNSLYTPNIDKLASQGMLFTHVFSNPFCSPSRATLITGRYPFANGLTTVLHSLRQENIHLSPAQPSFARQLKERGYATAIAGKWHMSLLHKHNHINEFGFDEYQVWQIFGEDGEKTRRFWKPHLNRNGTIREKEIVESYGPDENLEFLTDFMKTSVSNKQPFFAYFATPLPHFPWEPTPDSDDPDAYRKPHNEHKGDPRYFTDLVDYFDKCLGIFMETLDELGIAENTILIFLSDNGTDRDLTTRWADGRLLQGGKGTMTDRGTRVPMIVRWPGKIEPGSANHDLIDFSDFFPTICALTGASLPPDTLNGRSFHPQLLGQDGNPREWVHYQHGGARIVRSHDYILTNDDKLRPVVDFWEDPAETLSDALSEREQAARQQLKQVFADLNGMDYSNSLSEDMNKD